MRVWYIDSTLRDGEQAPGVSFSPLEKVHIASMLDSLGIHEAEIGTPAMGKTEIATMRDIATSGFNYETLSWCRAIEDDIHAAIKTCTSGINISFPVSKIQLEALGKDENWVYKTMPKLISRAKDHFNTLAIGLQDASRADYGFLKNIINLANGFYADRIRIADTIGCLNPFSTQVLFQKLILDFPTTNFEFHGHNDLGMATANSLAAISSGAQSLSTTINGLGERAGNTPIDEIAMALKYSVGLESNLNLHNMQEISEYVAQVSGRPIHDSKPITGRKVFCHESGIHANSLLKNKHTYQLIEETDTGRDPELDIVFGKHSGMNALIDFFGKNGLSLTKKNAASLLEQVKMHSEIRKDNLPGNEVIELFYQLT